MKQYYESELIKEIVEARGHKKSSLHYESECVKSWIEETKGAYPKLCDYQSEWISYINKIDGGGTEQPDPEPPIGEFPYVVLSDVTEATVDNVVPYAYKSAILKGLTLVNVKGEKSNDNPMNGYSNHDFLIPLVKKNTDYLIKYDTTLSGGVLALGFLNSTSWSNNIEEQPNIGLIRLNSGEYPNYFRIVGSRGQTVSINNLMIIEYQEGMENWDIPYFEGMQSVKMPVLKTLNNQSNLFFTQSLTNFLSWRCICFDTFIKAEIYVKADGTVSDTLRLIVVQNINGAKKENVYNNDSIKKGVNVEVENVQFIGFHDRPNRIEENGNGNLLELIESGKLEIIVSDKTNILTVNEDVTLRSNGSVYDELDLLLGKLTQRIDENGEVLSQEVVKTVDLNIQDQDGKTLSAFKPIEGTMFLSTSSDTIKPLFSGEIPVEATTQNLASFIDLEMEE